MKKQVVMRCLRGALPIAMSAFIAVTPVGTGIFGSGYEVHAEENTAADVSLTFIDESGNEIGKPYTEEELKEYKGQTLKEASLAHESYYDKKSGKSYDIVDANELNQVLGKATTVTYRLRSSDNDGGGTTTNTVSVTPVYYTADQDEKLQRHEITDSAFQIEMTNQFTGMSAEADQKAPETITVPGVESEGTCDVTFVKHSTLLYDGKDNVCPYTILYTPANIDYTIKVHYIDASTDQSLGDRECNVNDSKTPNLEYTVPQTFTKEITYRDGTKSEVRYNVKAEGSNIYQDPKDNAWKIYHAFNQSQLEYTVYYEPSAENAAYNWYIAMVDSRTGKQIQKEALQVAYNQDATFDAVAKTPSGYKLNPSMQKSYTHKFADANQVTYVFYDPEGYTDNQDPYDVTVQYLALSTDENGTIIQTPLTDKQIVKILPDGDTNIPVPEEYAVDGKTYKLMNGQATTIVHPYYTTERKAAYEVYYIEEGSTLEPATIVREVVHETTTVVDGQTIVRYIPGVTTTVVENVPGTNTATVIRTQNATGATANTVSAPDNAGTDNQASNNTDTSNVESGRKRVVDNVEIEDEETPRGNVDIDDDEDTDTDKPEAKDSKFPLAQVAVGGVAILAILIALIAMMRKKK